QTTAMLEVARAILRSARPYRAPSHPRSGGRTPPTSASAPRGRLAESWSMVIVTGKLEHPRSTSPATRGSRPASPGTTRLARTSGATDDKGALADVSWVDYDVKPLVAGNGTYSFVLATSSDD